MRGARGDDGTRDPDARYRDLLSRQLVANEEAWAALVAHGVTANTSLGLAFAFGAPSEEAAAALARVLREETDYDVEIAPDDDGDASDNARWAVVGRTQPTALSVEVLDAWVEWMVAAGLQQDCDFGGWRTTL